MRRLQWSRSRTHLLLGVWAVSLAVLIVLGLTVRWRRGVLLLLVVAAVALLLLLVRAIVAVALPTVVVVVRHEVMFVSMNRLGRCCKCEEGSQLRAVLMFMAGEGRQEARVGGWAFAGSHARFKCDAPASVSEGVDMPGSADMDALAAELPQFGGVGTNDAGKCD